MPYPTIDEIVRAVATAFEVEPEQIYAKTNRYADARRAVYMIACLHTKKTLADIGQALGGRHHSTVLTGRERAFEEMEIYTEFREKVDSATASLGLESQVADVES